MYMYMYIIILPLVIVHVYNKHIDIYYSTNVCV